MTGLLIERTSKANPEFTQSKPGVDQKQTWSGPKFNNQTEKWVIKCGQEY